MVLNREAAQNGIRNALLGQKAGDFERGFNEAHVLADPFGAAVQDFPHGPEKPGSRPRIPGPGYIHLQAQKLGQGFPSRHSEKGQGSFPANDLFRLRLTVAPQIDLKFIHIDHILLCSYYTRTYVLLPLLT